MLKETSAKWTLRPRLASCQGVTHAPYHKVGHKSIKKIYIYITETSKKEGQNNETFIFGGETVEL